MPWSRFRQHLEAELSRSSGIEQLSALRQLLDQSGSETAPFSRENYSPGHLTASAFVVEPSEGKLLLIDHRKLGLWLQPGGHLEPSDENFVEAALRELAEETGLRQVTVVEPLFDVDVHSIPQHGAAPAHLHFDLRVLFLTRSAAIVAGAEVHAARWFLLSDIVTGTSQLADGRGTDSSVVRVVRRIEQQLHAGRFA